MISSLFRALALLLAAGAALAAAMSDQVVRYQIEARLDPALKTVTGQETLSWRNDSNDAVRELRFHLYLNAFQNEKSTFVRESGGRLRGGRVSKDDWGYIEVTRLEAPGGLDLTRALRFLHPDDDNADDRTVAAVTLPQPVNPHQTITLRIAFLSKLPKIFARTGYRGDFFMIGQWFPKLGVYEKAGDRYARQGAWNCHQFHANTEFYADYGVYDVSLTVPSNYQVGATGVQRSATRDASGKLSTYRFYQEDVHDFSWTASPGFLRVERTFDPARAVAPAEQAAAGKLLGLGPQDLRLKPVKMILLLQPEHASQTARHLRALENALKWFGLWYGAYPYDTITLVDPPYGADGAGGMEYPNLITAGTTWWPGEGESTPEEVIVHEFGHQYWYGMVGTNEFEESWLDEGFNTYSTGKVIDLVYGPRDLPVHFAFVPLQRLLGLPTYTEDDVNRAVYLQYGKLDPIVRNGWEYYSDFSYGVNSYMRPAALLRTLENYLGSPVMARIMRTWFQRYRFRHPASLDFEKLVNEISGRDMTWFFDQFVFGTNWLNYKVESVDSDPVNIELGSYLENGKRREVSEKDAERIEKARKDQGRKPDYRTVIKLKRDGEAIFPVEMMLTFENGEVVRENWDGRDRWKKYEYIRPSPADRVEIDPGRKILLDGDFADNSWVPSPAPLPFAKWTSNLLFWAQLLLP